MDRINITGYKAALGTYVAYIGRATLKERYEFANGDESFYREELLLFNAVAAASRGC